MELKLSSDRAELLREEIELLKLRNARLWALNSKKDTLLSVSLQTGPEKHSLTHEVHDHEDEAGGALPERILSREPPPATRKLCEAGQQTSPCSAAYRVVRET